MLTKNQKHLALDLAIVGGSLIVAVVLGATNLVELILTRSEVSIMTGSLVAGIFFTSIFTSLPATVALGEIAQLNNVFLVALFGALGSLLGDLFIFRFVRDNIRRDLDVLIEALKREERWLRLHRRLTDLKYFHLLVPLFGAVIIASPLPDELGLLLLGLSRIKTGTVAALTFSLNFLGILVIGLIAQGLA
ncbi:MAG: hypothetical protein HYV42_02030 [Candidatus Magasanikbacteria bacterium]|nr:hypothetical protein [Candidatus Magasanikbacteria bacterium]